MITFRYCWHQRHWWIRVDLDGPNLFIFFWWLFQKSGICMFAYRIYRFHFDDRRTIDYNSSFELKKWDAVYRKIWTKEWYIRIGRRIFFPDQHSDEDNSASIIGATTCLFCPKEISTICSEVLLLDDPPTTEIQPACVPIQRGGTHLTIQIGHLITIRR